MFNSTQSTCWRKTVLVMPALLLLAACSGEPEQPAATQTPSMAAPEPTGITPVTDADLVNAAARAGEWLSYGLNPGETRYSPLDQITFSNVADLGVAWT